jgi:hypothetical protein
MACAALEAHCAICKMPLPSVYRKTPDERLFCERDFRAGVFELADAQRIFRDAAREARGLLAGTGSLPDRNIAVWLVDRAELAAVLAHSVSAHNPHTTLGLTRTRKTGHGRMDHDIYLLNGLGRARLAAVAAHEFAHTWLHENVPPGRELEGDTVEGFCELVAYKVMHTRGEENEKKVILANAYTRGQIDAFVAADSQHHFHRIVAWMRTGVDDALFATNSARVLAVNAREPEPLAWPPPARQATPVPETLALRGISGTSQRRFALINDATLEVNERARVRVGGSNVVLRCLEIAADSALVQVEGAPAPQRLRLKGN